MYGQDPSRPWKGGLRRWRVAVADFFGRKNFAKISGAMSFIYTWGGVVGAVAAGLIYDRTQDYGVMLRIPAIVLVVTGAAYALLTKPPIPEAAAHG